MKDTLLIMMLSVFVLSSCNQNKTKDDGTTSAKVEEIKKPKMDLHTAAVMGNVAIMENHIVYGSDLNVKEPMGGATPMITAALFGKTQMEELLIKGGADVNAQNNENSTALHTAAFCHQDVVKLLLDNNADKSVRNVHGATALESVQAPFDTMKPIYEHFNKELKPLGIVIDLDRVEKARPIIAEKLSE